VRMVGDKHLSSVVRGLLRRGGESLDQRQQEEVGHVGYELAKHAALTGQGLSAPLGRVGLEVPIISQFFSGGAQHRQQDHCEGIDQLQAISPVRRTDVHRSEPHAEPWIFSVAEPALALPTLA
jgi:hypothetical protein